MEEKVEKELELILTNNDSLPFLFIGSGFTRRYLNAPDWVGLLKIFCKIIDPDNEYLYNQYYEIAKQQLKSEGINISSVNAMNSKIADIIEDNFNLLWYKDGRFKESRKINKNLIDYGNSPFKIELAAFFNELMQHSFSLELELNSLSKLTESSIAGIITTNYDTLLERFFNFDKYVGQENLIFSDTLGICEIYKIHGCCTEPKSMIINSDDYKKFEAKNKYLAAKLLTIFVEHPIVFIGYSIQDENIRSIIDSILDCLNESQLLSFKKRFIFIERLNIDENEEIKLEEAIYSSHTGKTMAMTKVYLKDYGTLYEILSKNKSKYPTKILRKLKKDVFELVTSTKPSEKLKIMIPFNDLEKLENVEFVVGVGIAKATDLAYASYSAEDIYSDIVFDDKSFISNLLIENTLPPHLSRTSGSMPFYKYLIAYSGSAIPDIYTKYLKNDIENFYNNGIRRTRESIKEESINEIVNKYEYPKSLYYVTRLKPEFLDVKQLHNYLADILTKQPNEICTGKNCPQSSDLRRLIKILDWLLYYNK